METKITVMWFVFCLIIPCSPTSCIKNKPLVIRWLLCNVFYSFIQAWQESDVCHLECKSELLLAASNSHSSKVMISRRRSVVTSFKGCISGCILKLIFFMEYWISVSESLNKFHHLLNSEFCSFFSCSSAHIEFLYGLM